MKSMPDNVRTSYKYDNVTLISNIFMSSNHDIPYNVISSKS